MALTNKLNLPKPFVDACASEYQYKPRRYSVTSVLKGTREAILTRRHHGETTQDVADMVWMIFGSAVHKILEESKETDSQLKESWLSVEMPNGYELSGIFDLYDAETKTVTDYKTASVWKVIYDEWDDYRKQTLIYCWMLRKLGFEANKGQIVALLKDHSKSKAKRDKDYPQFPVIVKEWEFSEREFDSVGSFLEVKFAEIERAEKLPDDELPQCTREERWSEPSKWAVMKHGRKSALKLYDTQEDAEARASCENDNSTGAFYVEHRPGCSKKCAEYCAVSEFCNQWKEECNV